MQQNQNQQNQHNNISLERRFGSSATSTKKTLLSVEMINMKEMNKMSTAITFNYSHE